MRDKSIIFICRLNCASWLPSLRESGSENVWVLGSELGLSVAMVLGAPVGSPIIYSITMLIGLAHGNLFGTWEGPLVGFSLVTLVGLMIGTVEGYLFGLAL